MSNKKSFKILIYIIIGGYIVSIMFIMYIIDLLSKVSRFK